VDRSGDQYWIVLTFAKCATTYENRPGEVFREPGSTSVRRSLKRWSAVMAEYRALNDRNNRELEQAGTATQDGLLERRDCLSHR